MCDDILDLLMFIDERKLIDNLLMYAAVNLEKIPDLKPEELELVCISRKLDELDKRITSVEASSCAEVIMCKLDDLNCLHKDHYWTKWSSVGVIHSNLLL